MTVIADNKKRVTIRHAKPGDRFDVQVAGNGRFILTKLEPALALRPAKCESKSATAIPWASSAIRSVSRPSKKR